MIYDQCVVDFLRLAGVRAEWIKLGDIGVHGNGHFSFLEKNNLQIAAVVESWIREVNHRDVKQNEATITSPISYREGQIILNGVIDR